jgi:mono/diheme cytochrome c family protein
MALSGTAGLRTLVRAGAIGALAAAGAAQGAGDAEKGEALAVKRCAQCHVIGAQNPHGGVSNSPSFYIFAEKPQVYMERLQSFSERRPHKGRDMDATAQDLEHIMTYVRTLKRPQK